tara:strand:- start:217 stop:990 length:774 start_codon:yes stop_codon:yes gene_type:complete
MATEVCGGDVSLRIKNLAVKKEVVFSQIKMTGFTDTVTPSWSEEVVYGRMDPIATYQGTTRAMSLSFELGPFSESDDRKKLALEKISRLMQFQYPTYSGAGSAAAISRPPLLEINFHNYIREGLVCYVSEISYAPVDGMSATTVPKFNGTEILPQRISVSLNIKVLHTTAPGWSDSGVWSGAPVGPADTSGPLLEAAADAAAAASDAADAAATAASEAAIAAAAAAALEAAAAAEKAALGGIAAGMMMQSAFSGLPK